MTDDVIERLRRLDPVPERLPPPPLQPLLLRLERWPDGPTAAGLTVVARGRRRRIPSSGALVTVFSVFVAVVIAVGALALLGDRGRAPQTRATSRASLATPGRRELIAMLGVLRRPQTKADIDPWLVRFIRQRDSRMGLVGTPDVPLMRRVTTSWGENLYLIALKPPSASALHATWERMGRPRPPLRQFVARNDVETLGLFTSNGGGGSQTAADIQYLGSDAFEGAHAAGLSPAQGGYQYLIRVVPDGVAKVVFVVRGHLGRVEPGIPANPPPATVAVTVHDNVAAARIKRKGPAGRFEAIWYATNGRALRRSYWP